MSRIADHDGIEQPKGSFLHREQTLSAFRACDRSMAATKTQLTSVSSRQAASYSPGQEQRFLLSCFLLSSQRLMRLQRVAVLRALYFPHLRYRGVWT
jgi:hypothetical protein